MADAPEPVDYVLDASALAKLFLEEPESPAFRAWYLGEVQRGATFGAPSLLGYEVAHLLSRNLAPPGSAADRAPWLSERYDEVMTGIGLDEGAARRTFALTDKLTGYDASYVAVAASGRATLVTYDQTLTKEARRRGIRVNAPA